MDFLTLTRRAWGSLSLKEVANDRQGRLELEEELGLAEDRQDLCDRLAVWYALRERDRWKVLD